MKPTVIVVALAGLAALVAACDRQEPAEENSMRMEAPVAVTPSQEEEAPAIAGPEESAPASEPAPPAESSRAEPAAPSVEAAPAPATMTTPRPVAVAPAGVLGRDEGLVLAQKAGCLACHKIDAKLVGPAWQDVSAKYRGDADAKAHLIEKVKTGGQGNWTEVTGGIPMPPYSPRVSDEDIERLVMFVLSL